MQKKLQHLTIVSLAIKAKSIPYALLLSELEIDNVRHLEDVIIEAIYAGMFGQPEGLMGNISNLNNSYLWL